MAVTGDGDEFPDSSAALGIALAMQYKVHGFAGLRPDKCLVQIRSGTEGHVRESVQSIERGICVQCRKRSPVPCVHGLQQVIAAFVANLAHDDAVGTMTKSCRNKLAWRDGDLTGDCSDSFPSNRVRMGYFQLRWLLDHDEPFVQRNMVKERFHERRLA